MKYIVRLTETSENEVKGIRLTTGEEVILQTNSLASGLSELGLSVDDPTDLVITWDDKEQKPIKYISNIKNDIMLDEHQPDAWMEPLGVAEKVSMYAGDYGFKTVHGFMVLAEFKTSNDFYASLWDVKEGNESATSRLAGQIPKLVASCDIPILHIDLEGLSCTPDGKIHIVKRGDKGIMFRTWTAMWNTMLGYQIVYPQLKLWFSRRSFRVPYDILSMRNYLNKISHFSQASRPAAEMRELFKSMEADEAWLAALMGQETAKQALKAHGSIWNLMQLDEKELIKIPLWGKKTATKFLNILKKGGTDEQTNQ
uniref:Nuclease n=2 Tax=viral metagenome TaxID=1070528 RepID=A0A6M3KPA3_9ZZZZ